MAKELATTYKDVTPATAEAMAKGLYNTGSREAGEQLRKIKEELEPMLRLHGLRVTINAANVPGREEYREKEDAAQRAAAQKNVGAAGQKRYRDLTGLPAVP